MKYHIIYLRYEIEKEMLYHQECRNSQETIKWIQLNEPHIEIQHIILGQYIDLVKTYTLEEAP